MAPSKSIEDILNMNKAYKFGILLGFLMMVAVHVFADNEESDKLYCKLSVLYQAQSPTTQSDTPIIIDGPNDISDITSYISAACLGGSISSINGRLQSGSQLNWGFYNNSSESVTLKSLQLIDGQTGQEGNVMSVNQTVEANSSVAYTTTIGALGINTPVTCRFRYEYSGSTYSVDAVYSNSSPDIPDMFSVTLSIKASGNGSASYKGTSVRNTTSTFKVDRMSSATVTFSPDNGYQIKNVKVNGRDVTSSLSNNQYTISYISSNTSWTSSSRKSSSRPTSSTSRRIPTSPE